MTHVDMRSKPEMRTAYARFVELSTRWMDNDIYGHVNNAVYYSYFDSAVNELLIRAGVLDIEKGPTIGLVVESRCHYFRPIAYPDALQAGVRTARIGTSSVRYDIGIFRGDEADASAQGYFIHVYVDRTLRRPQPLSTPMRTFLQSMLPIDQTDEA